MGHSFFCLCLCISHWCAFTLAWDRPRRRAKESLQRSATARTAAGKRTVHGLCQMYSSIDREEFLFLIFSPRPEDHSLYIQATPNHYPLPITGSSRSFGANLPPPGLDVAGGHWPPAPPDAFRARICSQRSRQVSAAGLVGRSIYLKLPLEQ